MRVEKERVRGWGRAEERTVCAFKGKYSSHETFTTSCGAVTGDLRQETPNSKGRLRGLRRKSSQGGQTSKAPVVIGAAHFFLFSLLPGAAQTLRVAGGFQSTHSDYILFIIVSEIAVLTICCAQVDWLGFPWSGITVHILLEVGVSGISRREVGGWGGEVNLLEFYSGRDFLISVPTS